MQTPQEFGKSIFHAKRVQVLSIFQTILEKDIVFPSLGANRTCCPLRVIKFDLKMRVSSGQSILLCRVEIML